MWGNASSMANDVVGEKNGITMPSERQKIVMAIFYVDLQSLQVLSARLKTMYNKFVR